MYVEPTARLTLNAVDIAIDSATADDGVERADVALVAGRALEVIAISADLKARALPAIDAWIRADDGCARAFWERCLAWTFRIAMADKLSGARRIFHHG